MIAYIVLISLNKAKDNPVQINWKLYYNQKEKTTYLCGYI